MLDRTVALLLAWSVLAGASPARAQLETPARPHFDGGTARTLLACGRLVARLPPVDRDSTCGEPEDRPSIILGRERSQIAFDPDYVQLAIEIDELPFDAALLASRAMEFATWPSDFTTSGPRLRVQRRATGGLEVRLDDGSVFLVHVAWPEGDSYVDDDQPSPATLRNVDRDTQRLTSQLVLTLAPGPVGPMRAGTLRFRDADVEGQLTIADGVLMTEASARLEIEPTCEARYELATYGAGGDATRAFIGVCRDGRVTRSRVVSTMAPTVARALESVRGSSDRAPTTPTATPTPASPAPPPAPRACTYVVNDPAPPLRVRASFSSRAEIVGTLANGATVVIEERHGRWARIAAPAGWIWTENLEERCL